MGGDAQAFLEDLGGVGAVAAGRDAAHVEVMAERADDRHEHAVHEDGSEGEDVGDVLPAAIRVVGDDDVALVPLVGLDEVAQDRLQPGAHRVQVLRDTGRLSHVVAVGGEDGGRVVEQFADDRGAAGAPNGDIHLGGGGCERVAHDLQLDRADRSWHIAGLRFGRHAVGDEVTAGGRGAQRQPAPTNTVV